MQRSKSPSVSQDKFNSSKSVKFSFTSSPARKESPSRTHSRQMSKSQQSFQPAPKPQRAASPKPAIPLPHSVTKKKEEEPTRYNSAMRSSNVQTNTTMYKSIPNPMSQSFSPQKREARLQDLCTEDKMKIGDLMKKLADEKDEKDRLRRELESKDSHYKNMIQNLTKENDFVVKDSIELQNQFKYSLNLLKDFQDAATKQQKQKEKEEKKQRKLKKQQEEQTRYQQYVREQELLKQQQDKERQQNSEQRVYDQQKQRIEFLIQQEERQKQELEKQQKLKEEQEYQEFVEKQSYRPLNYTQVAQTTTNETRRNMSSPLIKPKPREGSPYLESGTRKLIQTDVGQAAQTLRGERIEQRIDQRIKSPTKEEVNEAFQREERVMSEIAKIKSDIESLTHSFKKINFASNESTEVKPRNQLLPEPKSNSPIKFMQNFKSAESSAQRQQKRRPVEEEELYEDQLYPQILPVRPEVQRESPAKPPLMKRGGPAALSTANVPYQYEAEPGSTSSDEDELAVAQKWLNLRKDKLRQVNQQLGENRENREAYQEVEGIEQDSLYNEEHRGQQEEEDYYPQEQQEPPRRHVEYQSAREEAQQQKNIAAKSSPSFRDINTGRFVSDRKRDSDGMLSQNSLRRPPNSGSRLVTNDPGVINLNQLTVDDMIKLKNALEEKIHGEKPQELINSKVEFAIRSPEKPKSLLNQANYQTFSHQGTTNPDLVKSGSSFRNYEYNPADRYGKSGSRTMHSEANEYERSGFKESSRKGLGDSSIVRDFDSIAYTRPESYKLTETYKDTEGFGLVTEAPRTLEDESSQMEEYEEKLQEFLRVRDRLIKQNKIRNQGVEIENVFTSGKAKGSNHYDSAQKSHQTNSPPSVRSVGRLEAPRMSDRDLMKQVMQNQGIDYQSRGQQNARFFRENPKSEALEEAMTPDYGYGTSQRSQKTTPARETEADDFYDENLFELVDDIEHRESAKPTPSKSTLETKSTTRLVKGLKDMKDIKKVENEFNSLFNTMRSMFTNNEDNTTTERIREKLLNKFDKSDLVHSKISSEDEDRSESYSNLPQQVLEKGNERRASDLSGHFTHGRPSKTDSSVVETDTSILAITKKIDELKKNKKVQRK